MPRPERYPLLLVDAGNTAVKFASVARAGAKPELLRSVPTSELTASTAKRASAGMKSAVVCSVVPSVSRILKRAFPAAKFIGPRTPLGFRTSADRRTIGADRLAGVAGAHARYGGNVLVVSFGTAATFDVLDARGVHRGGAIAPGWKIFAGILSGRTEQLPRTSAGKPRRLIGRNTREALAAGVSGGYAAMVSQLVAGMKREAKTDKLRVMFTGGDAGLVAELTGLEVVTDPLLTLRGIAVLAERIAREGSK